MNGQSGLELVGPSFRTASKKNSIFIIMKRQLLILLLFVCGLAKAQQDSLGKPINLTVEQYTKLTSRTDKLVLVNLQADWCVVCKREKPLLQQIVKDNANVVLIEVDMDDNPLIAQHFEVDGLPVNLLYRGGHLIWNRMGLISKDEINAMIKAASAK